VASLQQLNALRLELGGNDGTPSDKTARRAAQRAGVTLHWRYAGIYPYDAKPLLRELARPFKGDGIYDLTPTRNASLHIRSRPCSRGRV
jgi:hypothetical protein